MKAFKENVFLTRSKPIVGFEKFLERPSIRIFLSAGFTKKEVEKAGVVVREAVRAVAKAKIKM
jgi:serine palmitoyltransferase